MARRWPDAPKRLVGGALSAVLPQCRYPRLVVMIAHMRCGSTALSNIICTHPDVSGYGEAHVRHDGQAALGVLVLNQAKRGGYSPRAHYLYDKILHDRYDAPCPESFFRARAIFLARPPRETIASIRKLFATIGSSEYASDTECADYYERRLERVLDLWPRFAPNHRVGLTHAMLMAEPELQIARISELLHLSPALTNRYRSNPASRGHGGGDPIASARFDKIVPRARIEGATEEAPLALDRATLHRLDGLYARFVATCTDRGEEAGASPRVQTAAA